MVSATDRCLVCNEPLAPGARFCPHCGARVEDRSDVDDKSRRTWVPLAAIVALVAIVAVVAIAFATTSGGGGGNPPGTSVGPTTPATSARPPVTTSRPAPTTPRTT